MTQMLGTAVIIRQMGNTDVSQGIVNEVVGREMRRLNAENEILRARRNEELGRKRAEARARYVWPMEPWFVRAWDVMMATLYLLRQWRRETRAEARGEERHNLCIPH